MTGRVRPALVSIALAGSGVALATSGAAATLPAPPDSSTERQVHSYLQVVIAPDGAHVASVEGDSPPGGYYPDLRDLIIRRVADGAQTRVAPPCGRVAQCWPSSPPAWSPDGKHLSFALRTPRSHAYAVYDVSPSGTNLTRLLSFSGTITHLKFRGDGTLAMLAVALERTLAWFDEY